MSDEQRQQEPRAPISPVEFEHLVGKVKERLEADNKGFMGWLRTWGVILAFVLSCLALVRTVRDEAYDYFRGVTISKIKNAPFNVTYTLGPEGQVTSITYLFSFRVINKKNETHPIEHLNASIETPKTTEIKLDSYDAMPHCIDPENKDKELVPPLLVGADSHLSFKCQLELPTSTAGTELMQPGVCQRLTVRLNSEKGDDPVSEEFEFNSTGELVVAPADFGCD